MRLSYLKYFILLLLFSCSKEEGLPSTQSTGPYSISGRIIDNLGKGIEGLRVYYDSTEFILTDRQGFWLISDLEGKNTIEPFSFHYLFSPALIEVNTARSDLTFRANRVLSETEVRLFNWFDNQRLANGLLETAEDAQVSSLYDNALAAMVFMLQDEFNKAEAIFDFFKGRIDSELKQGPGGFSQLRNLSGTPNNHRWMGDNAWLLIALNNYKHRTGKNTYDNLSLELENWLKSLQGFDGGLYAGYNANNSRMNYKVSEGNIDAFNAIAGYTSFHANLLGFLKRYRWDAADQNLVAWPSNPTYLYALDLHSWSYLIFEDYPLSSLSSAQRFLTTKTATIGARVTGYCFDEDKDLVWPEGTGQMALAFGLADMQFEKGLYLSEMEKLLIPSQNDSNAIGFPYTSNLGTPYGPDPLWAGADTKIASSGAAWYLFAKFNFNPFAVGREKSIPVSDMFWLN
tara:strand:+ start:2142 stop:3512 length:1371 start_codon:yes stop_codon:yes gene_type:complete